MKTRMGILVVVLSLFSGCVAIPPLITVHHSDSKGSSSADKKRIEELENRVRELEQQLNQRR